MTPTSMAATRALGCACSLGESPVWDRDRGELLWVDINAGSVHRWAPGAARSSRLALGGELSAIVPRLGGGFLAAIGHRLLAFDPQWSEPRLLAEVEGGVEDNRFNDCRCDPQGRLWAGTMSKSRRPGTGSLYRLLPGGEPERVIAGTTISNGLGWSGDGETMYFVDSTTQRLDALDFDKRDGSVHDRRPLLEIDPADGLPDGIAIDAEDGIWIALFGGAALRRYTPAGDLDAVVRLPTSNPTCPAFGGPDLSTIYLTTARHKLSEQQLRAEPAAGDLFAVEPGVAGLPAAQFAG